MGLASAADAQKKKKAERDALLAGMAKDCKGKAQQAAHQRACVTRAAQTVDAHPAAAEPVMIEDAVMSEIMSEIMPSTFS